MHSNNLIFKRILTFTCIRDKDMVLDVFRAGGDDTVSRSQYEKWKTVVNNEEKKPMPIEKLNAFLLGLNELSKKGVVTVNYSMRFKDEK